MVRAQNNTPRGFPTAETRELESRPHGSVAVHRGPLHYAFDIPRTQKMLARNAQESRAVDLEFDATATWQYAIDPKTLKFNAGIPAGGKLPSPIFDSGLPPLTITATACPINWTVAGDTFTSAPPTNPVCTGEATNITLWPFGVSNKLPYTDVALLTISRRPNYESENSRLLILRNKVKCRGQAVGSETNNAPGMMFSKCNMYNISILRIDKFGSQARMRII